MFRIQLGLSGLKSIIWNIAAVIGEWQSQGRIFWEDITSNWEGWNTVLGVFKFWQEQTKNYWQNETTPTWDIWYPTYGSLIMIDEQTTNWESMTTNWENT